ncbi:PREDICTED: uncharacterized protein LOC106812783 [Priapulus caudatus]|uniref:Uncharacterized protein LOC106812783 n=1 Tax=Priapulus caudatus TaxID=37621 RepID=A0ABM1EJ72_PRICU|nr:PREDICTED: uncharacterized protein LOC106812783 [Priapulus caudatus]XP_014672243.1 PREDICTED: uncharacterized protein LOC106812783 [Priapulus caudatus]XP_014672244.1 PREDICTED: uncharacterized protein LOC106812783 [Priapulus caudatus]
MDYTVQFKYYLFVCLVLLVVQSHATRLIATFSMSGIKGNITFEQSTSGAGAAIIYVNLEGLIGFRQYDWHLHEFPTDWDANQKCLQGDIGNMMKDMGDLTARHGKLTAASKQYTDSTIQLSGLSTIYGRTLLLTAGGGVEACATIQDDGQTQVRTATAMFPTAIAGTMHFRQMEGGTLIIYTDLFYVNGRTDVYEYSWAVMSDPVVADLTDRVEADQRCTDLGSSLHMRSDVISVGTTRGSQKRFLTTKDMSLFGSVSIANRSLALFDNVTTVACANIRPVLPRHAVGTYSHSSVVGTVTFHQRSQFDPTTVTFDIEGLAAEASESHIHAYPHSGENGQEGACSREQTGPHYNPFDVPYNETLPLVGTNDVYEVGDFYGKFGPLDGRREFRATFRDHNLPLFGPNSIVGRSVDVHYVNGSRWVCANVGYCGSGDVATARARFTYPLVGEIVLRQPRGDPLAPTSVYVDLAWSTSLLLPTKAHAWRVHAGSVGDDFDAADEGRCGSALARYNPRGVATGGGYAAECSATSPLRCEVGDLVGKHGAIDVPPHGQRIKYLFTDPQLPLSGPQSVVSRSIVVHAPQGGAARLACADILEVPPVVASATFSQPGTPVSGSVQFSQDTSFSDSSVVVNLNGLGGEAGGYHVHVYTLDYWQENLCSDPSVAGHWNPYNVDKSKSPAPGTGTDDQYETGDLSGKFGSLKLLKRAALSYTCADKNLPMRGQNGIVGRSVVVHKEKEGARWACADVEEGPYTDARDSVSAIASFSQGDVIGYVRFRQNKRFGTQYRPNDATVEISLLYNKSIAVESKAHNWHVHISPVAGDLNSQTNRCKSAGPHYNPFHANLTDEYKEKCGPSQPWLCELGDMSSKLAAYDMGAGRRMYTDETLDLFGDFTIVNRSVVIHEANNGPARIACANIALEERVDKAVFISSEVDRLAFARMLVTELEVHPWTLTVRQVQSDSTRCYPVLVTFMSDGTSSATAVLSKLESLLVQHACDADSRAVTGSPHPWFVVLGAVLTLYFAANMTPK